MRRRIIATLMLALVLAGCSKPEPAAVPALLSTKPAVAATSESPTVATTEEPTPAVTTPTVTNPPPSPSFVTYTCYNTADDGTTSEVNGVSLKEVWSQGGGETCSAELSSQYRPTATEIRAVRLYHQFNAEETTAGALETMYGICAATKDLGGLEGWEKSVLIASASLCPKAPHAATITALAHGELFSDGTYEVGVDVKPGTYRTGKHMTDCYWERSTRGGATIANDFVGNAPAGVTVRIRKSDGGFKSEGCGTWTKVK